MVRPLPEGAAERHRHAAADRGRRRPWTGKTASFKIFPKTKVLTLPLKGT